MRNSNGFPPRNKEVNVRLLANVEYGHDSYTYHEIPAKEDVMKYYTKGVPPNDSV